MSGPTDVEATAVLGPRGSEDEPTRSNAASSGSHIGRFLVIEPLGRGGMGVVLRAYDPKLQREVALKLVRVDRLDRSAQTRLVREARAMARIAHPNVVAVYDVEIDPSSTVGVLIVMEYVAGVTLDRWSREQPRSPQQVVEAFIAAGRGLAAAHAEGLLHRDFKPANVLVGNDGRVRVTDFGLARVDTPGSSPEPSPHDEHPEVDDELTAAGTVLGTPSYMAPEQAAGGELDARADQYALCVALWEALAGRRPFEGRGDALLAAKLAGPPRWPSDVSVSRHVTDALRRGLAPDPRDRFASVPDLLATLDRDPTRSRRRRLAVAGFATLGLAGIGAHQLQRARTRSACATEGTAIADVWSAARADAIESAFATTGVSYAADTWSSARVRIDDYAAEWQRVRAQVCEEAELEQSRTAEAAAAARACLDERRDALQALLGQLDRPDVTVITHAATATASLPLLHTCTDAAGLRTLAETPSDPQTRATVAALRARLAESTAARATGRYTTAHDVAADVVSEAVELGWPPLVAEARFQEGEALRSLGRYEDAGDSLREAFFTAASAGRDEEALDAAAALVTVVGYRLARHEEGLHWGRLGQTFVDRLGLSDDLAVSILVANLASVHQAMGEYAEAQAMEERSLAIRQQVLGPEHPGVASSMQNLANTLFFRGEYAPAQRLYAQSLEIREHALGPNHPDVASSLLGLGSVALVQKDYARALPVYERALAIKQAALGPDHPELASALINLGLVRFGQGELAQARTLHERALAIQENALGPDHPTVAMQIGNLANVLTLLAEYEQSQQLLERALAIKERALGPDHPDVGTLLHNLGGVLVHRGQLDEARQLQERALAIYTRSQVPPSHLASSQLSLARTLWDAQLDRSRAHALASEARDTYRSLGPAAARDLADAQQWLDDHPLP